MTSSAASPSARTRRSTSHLLPCRRLDDEGAAGDTLSLPLPLPLAWTHPKAWKDLQSITATMFDGAKAIGSITLTPAGKVSATGKVSLGASTIGRHGKTVTAQLGFTVAKSLKGHTLSVDVSATDKVGKTQTE